MTTIGGEERNTVGAKVCQVGVMELSVSYGWCLLDTELAEMDDYHEQLVNATRGYLAMEELQQLRLALEIAYQSRAWSMQQRSDKRLRHAVSVALVLADLRMEVNTLSAALLAGVCEDAGITFGQIEDRLGTSVASAVADMSKVWQLSSLLVSEPQPVAGVSSDHPLDEPLISAASVQVAPDELERRCQMLLAGCEDWRGVVLSLASRLVTMRTMLELYNAQANALALQTLQVFVPLAHRLGMWYLKTELESVCFEISQPRAYNSIASSLARLEVENSEMLEGVVGELRAALRADPVLSRHADWMRVQARTKAPYSAWMKMRRKGLHLSELHDLIGLRIIFKPTSPTRLPPTVHWQRQAILCYRVLEVVHSIFPPVPGRAIKDYIANPKRNGYQSLHSSVRLEHRQLGHLLAEVQVRTIEMHKFAEHGKASHWMYKSEGLPIDEWQRLLDPLPNAAAASDTKSSHLGTSAFLSASEGVAVSGKVASPKQRRDKWPQIAGSRLTLLEQLRVSIREQRVYVVIRSMGSSHAGLVLSLPAGANLQDALSALATHQTTYSAEHTQRCGTALVNGRTVRREYAIRNGDVLTPIKRPTLNSRTWLAVSDLTKLAAPNEQPLVVCDDQLAPPWPWSLVGSMASEDGRADGTPEWYVESEQKHGTVSVLALANWIMLLLMGETSLDAEPLASLTHPVPAICWAAQFGAIALVEARNLQSATSLAIIQATAATDAATTFKRREPSFEPDLVVWPRIRAIGLWVGRCAMLVITVLALYADAREGLLHQFAQINELTLPSEAPRKEAHHKATSSRISPMEAYLLDSMLTSGNLVNDIFLLDIPLK
eukprot:CAMPEP_0119320374 /NCGR_PEP_ID=MMETSP1333-20130426/52259_1 /TAXON_ID=418940 /ORGANISM="Scyphosphaera apsteinii, Strain RCC1455" /LENGTH=833 /DNA_ID=CAMNT_0007327081 /DNA_START=127 /DNA_END=2628 /DNA_ORIENTATION=+